MLEILNLNYNFFSLLQTIQYLQQIGGISALSQTLTIPMGLGAGTSKFAANFQIILNIVVANTMIKQHKFLLNS